MLKCGRENVKKKNPKKESDCQSNWNSTKIQYIGKQMNLNAIEYICFDQYDGMQS